MCVDLKVLPRAGGLDNQDSDFVEELTWFSQRYDMAKFIQRAKMVLGDGDESKSAIDKVKQLGK